MCKAAYNKGFDATMNSEAIRAKFYEIAERASTPEYATLVRQLGDLMFARLQNTTANNDVMQEAVEALGIAFQELASTLGNRVALAEKRETENIRKLIDRVHNLSNRFMAVEDKVDQTVQLLDLKLEEILQAVSGANGGSTSNDGSTVNNGG